MTRKVEIDEELYAWIAAQTSEIGESASSILRRLLGLPPTGNSESGKPAEPKAPAAEGEHALEAVLQSVAFRSSNGVGRFLLILEHAIGEHPERIEDLLKVSGKKRRYFGRSASEIASSGSSTAPKQIGSTGIWVTTNTSSSLKQQILEQALSSFGYSSATVRSVKKAFIARH